MARCPLALAASAALAALACGGDDQGNADAGIDAISTTCLEAMQHSDLTWIQDKIFQPSCAGFRDCHQGAAVDAAHLSLERGQSHTQLVDVATEFMPTAYVRVKPGDPAASYLMIAIGSIPRAAQGRRRHDAVQQPAALQGEARRHRAVDRRRRAARAVTAAPPWPKPAQGVARVKSSIYQWNRRRLA